MKKATYFSIIFLLFSLPEISLGRENETERDSVLISSNWEIGNSYTYNASLIRNYINDTTSWKVSCSATQHILISNKTNDGFELEWTATGFPLNIFYDFPGTMFDWAEEWLIGKELMLKVKTDMNSTPLNIINQKDVRAFFTGMIDSMLEELPVRNVDPLRKEGVATALANIREQLIQSQEFPNYFLNNINLVFILYNKSFYTDQNEFSTVYKTVPTLKFSVPMKINTKFRQKEPHIVEVITSIHPHPYDMWKIKPKGYSNIDFEVEEYSRLIFDQESSWTNSAEMSYHFKRGKYEIASNISFILVQ